MPADGGRHLSAAWLWAFLVERQVTLRAVQERERFAA